MKIIKERLVIVIYIFLNEILFFYKISLIGLIEE